MNWLTNIFKRRRPLSLLESIEQHYSRNPAYDIAKIVRERDSLDPYAFVYGEVLADSLVNLLDAAGVRSGDRFYDLGSGSGKAVLAAGLSYPNIQAHGIEYMSELCDVSQQLAQSFATQNDLELPNITVTQGDIFHSDLSAATIVFINATGYFGESLEQLITVLSGLKPGTRIIIATKLLPEAVFKLNQQFDAVPMSWGHSRVSIYTRR